MLAIKDHLHLKKWISFHIISLFWFL